MANGSGINFLLDILKTFFILKKNLVGIELRDLARKNDLNKSEFITILGIYDKGPRTMSQLSEDTDLEKGSVTTMIDNLTAKGYAVRRSDEKDRRRFKVGLTQKGKSFAEKVSVFIRDNLIKRFELLCQKDKDEFYKALKTIKETFSKIGEHKI